MAVVPGRLSLIVPVYRNEENLPALIQALHDLSDRTGGRLEVVFTIDGSPDRSGERLASLLPTLRFPARVVFHSRNFGSFTAIRTGMEMASGELLAVMAADLQEPPELVLQFFEILETGETDVVFGQRDSRRDGRVSMLLSTAFWSFYRRFIVRDIPPGGVDMFACTRQVRDVILSIEEPNSSLVAQLFWVGFRRSFVPYARRPRAVGESGWSLSRRFRYMLDSIFSYSDLPILLVLWIGVAGVALSLLFAMVVIISRLAGFIDERGYSTIVLMITFFGSLSLAVQGVIGSYLWRTFENTKQRPLRIISGVIESDGQA
ncbi:glycosyltransferase family 2 protein [Sphingomonas sp. IC-56]|uniref:glycosyltransferase family 2 protein n=1 Tax=Sphingomonas sp. IC-56 TaxID=2898529 RepID=UPI001E308C79|nr:glycosyltransferase family 2 protein [Sphingomonas sp. IC-56]